MLRGRRLFMLMLLTAGVLSPPALATATVVTDQDAYGSVSGSEVVLGNAVIERRWRADVLATTSLLDKRTDLELAGDQHDLSLILDGVELTSDILPVADVTLEAIPEGGVRARFRVLLPDAVELERVTEVYPGIAGFRSSAVIRSLAPVIVSGYALDEVAAGGDAAATLHWFRAGADWRYDEGWEPALSIGDHQPGHWRVSSTAPAGQPVEGPGQWLSLGYPSGERVFTVMERNNYASSRVAYDGDAGGARVDLSRDIIYFGPIEESVHVDNPGPGPSRHRTVLPHRPLRLETVFTGMGADADDEPWQYYRYLDRWTSRFPKTVMFNTDKVDVGARSTGAKDDADFERFLSLLPAAEQMGVETFIFDDGWQARSGDWCADAHDCPEPRWDGTEDSKFRPRFPDPEFAAVGELLEEAGMELGLWFTPMEFHPSAQAFETNPQWACAPTGHGTAALNIAEPNGGSNEAGIGVWNPEAWGLHPDSGEPMKLIDYIEDRIERAIEVFGARFFKFDYLAFIDCVGVEPVDLYDYQDSFAAMLDRLRDRHPTVSLGIDETNDYRMFPRSVSYGPAWFQNGTPRSEQLLHNLWNLAPYVPGSYIGQHALGRSADRADRGIDYLMAVALTSAITFWLPIDTALDDDERARVKLWTDFYKQNRERLAGFSYPLLADPLQEDWTALQPWNPDEGAGFLLAFRQDSPEPTRAVPLRGIRDGSYELTAVDPAEGTETALGTFDAQDLRQGLEVTIAEPYGYALIRIDPEQA